MLTVFEHIRNHILGAHPTLDELYQTEWSNRFEVLMRNRLVVGSFRYGRLRAVGKPQYNRCEYIIRKIDEYKQGGNIECLVDIANLALCEFVEGTHQLKHFHSKGDHDEHAKEI